MLCKLSRALDDSAIEHRNAGTLRSIQRRAISEKDRFMRRSSGAARRVVFQRFCRRTRRIICFDFHPSLCIQDRQQHAHCCPGIVRTCRLRARSTNARRRWTDSWKQWRIGLFARLPEITLSELIGRETCEAAQRAASLFGYSRLPIFQSCCLLRRPALLRRELWPAASSGRLQGSLRYLSS